MRGPRTVSYWDHLLGSGIHASWDTQHYIDGLVQDGSNSSALAIELLQSCTKPSIWCLQYPSQTEIFQSIVYS